MASGLATRCSACGTVFRVVVDQLRVSEGWVRCGRCSEVFNAAEALVDLDTGQERRLAFDPSAAPPPQAASHDQDTIAELEEPPTIDSSESRFAPDDAEPQPAPVDPEYPLQPEPEPGPPAPAPATAPSFVRRAERAQRWRQPRVRAALAALALLFTLALAAQAAFEYREQIAARAPNLRPLLAGACGVLGCSVGQARSIDTINVESSGLVRVEKSSIYRLSVVLRNRAGFDVAVPALELAVTDSQGKLLARRVLRPAEMGASQIALGAGRDLTLQATLQVATEPVAGYTIETFYP